MASNFKIKWRISDEGVPGGLSIGARPKNYSKYVGLFDAGKEVRKIDDLRELRIPYYPKFSPFEYQREAVLRMLGRFRGKGIFGDQVGLGKTIEVGMTVAEFSERGAIKSVLLLCPNRLVFQWSQEIAEKFCTHFSGMNINSLDEIGKNEDDKRARGENRVTMYIMAFDKMRNYILSLRARLQAEIAWLEKAIAAEKFAIGASDKIVEYMRELENLQELNGTITDELDDNFLKLYDRYSKKLPDISMLIVDEADALLASSANRKTQIYRVVEHLSASIPYRILMSATPIRRQLADIYSLMKIVRPEQFRDENDFITNYCFSKRNLSDFKENEINKLKGIIDQLFTRNRLSSKTVMSSLQPLKIEEALRLDFANFANPKIAEYARNAVWVGVMQGESGVNARLLKQFFFQYSSLEVNSEFYWAKYIYEGIIAKEPSMRPCEITDEKDKAFAAKLLELLQDESGADVDALRFSLENYAIPDKKGHLILYKGVDDIDEVMHNREARRIMEELGLGVSRQDDYENFSLDNYICDGKFSEFDRLVNGKLAGQKVVVFSDNDAVREQFITITGSRALNAKGDSRNENYFHFRSSEAQYADSVYFAVNGQEKGINMQFCSNLIIANLSHDPNLVEQIVGRISRINQKNNMNIYVFAPVNSLEHYLYKFYNEVLRLFTTWDGDNTFIIGGAVSSFLDAHPQIRHELGARVSNSRTEDGELMEIGFSQIVEWIYNDYNEGLTTGTLEDNGLWASLMQKVKDSIESFHKLVTEFGEQEILESDINLDL